MRSKFASLLGRFNGVRTLRIATLLLVTAVSSFTLGALYASLHSPQIEPAIEELKPDKIPFFLRDSLSTVRCAAAHGSNANFGHFKACESPRHCRSRRVQLGAATCCNIEVCA